MTSSRTGGRRRRTCRRRSCGPRLGTGRLPASGLRRRSGTWGHLRGLGRQSWRFRSVTAGVTSLAIPTVCSRACVVTFAPVGSCLASQHSFTAWWVDRRRRLLAPDLDCGGRFPVSQAFTSGPQLREQETFTSSHSGLTTDLSGKGVRSRVMGLLAQPVLDSGELGQQLPDAELCHGAVFISDHVRGLPDLIEVKQMQPRP